MPSTSPRATSNIPDAILQLDALYQAELATFRRAEAIAAESRERWAPTGLTAGIFTTSEEPELRLFDAIFSHVIALATSHLAHGPAAPNIDMTQWRSDFLHEGQVSRAGHPSTVARISALRRSNLQAFQPSALWTAILDAYPSDRVEHEVRSRAATAIAKALQLRRQHEVQRVGGRVQISIGAWSEPKFSRPSERSYTYNSTRDFRGQEEAFRVFADASGLTDRQDAIAELGKTLDAIGATYFTFQSRDRTDVGRLISIQFFNNTIKILLPHEIASALNLFVSTYVRDL